jgi:uncharacterized protein YjbI with pentapeptide repeats
MVTFELGSQDLTGINFSFADLGGADFTGANLTSVNFTGATLTRAVMSGVMTSNTRFRYADLSLVNFGSSSLQNVDFYGARLAEASFTLLPNRDFGAILDGADFRQADLAGADFTKASLVGTLFNVGTIFTGATFGEATMTSVDLSNTTLTGAVSFHDTNLANANFSGADLSHVSFRGADLTNANLSGAQLSYTSFVNAILTGVDFSGTNLSGADFTDATDAPNTSTTTTTVAVTATTTVPLTCATGGSCAVGDTGPGGGIVVYAGGSGSSTYLEVANQTWYSSSEAIFRWCHPQVALVGASGVAIGTGRANSAAIRSVCTSNGGAYWIHQKNLAGGVGGKTDWHLPSLDELNQVCRYARQLPVDTAVCSGGTLRAGFIGASYWSSTERSTSYAWYQNFSNGGQAHNDSPKSLGIYVRPVRLFGP